MIAVLVYRYGWTSLLWLAAPRLVIIYVSILLYLAKDNNRYSLIICLVPALSAFVLRSDNLGSSPALYRPL